MKRWNWVTAGVAVLAIIAGWAVQSRSQSITTIGFLRGAPPVSQEDLSDRFADGPYADVYHLPRRYADVLAEAERELPGAGWVSVPVAAEKAKWCAEWVRNDPGQPQERLSIGDLRILERRSHRQIAPRDGRAYAIVVLSRAGKALRPINRFLGQGPKALFGASER